MPNSPGRRPVRLGQLGLFLAAVSTWRILVPGVGALGENDADPIPELGEGSIRIPTPPGSGLNPSSKVGSRMGTSIVIPPLRSSTGIDSPPDGLGPRTCSAGSPHPGSPAPAPAAAPGLDRPGPSPVPTRPPATPRSTPT